MELGAEHGPGIMLTTPAVSARHPLGYRVLIPQPGGMSAAPMAYADNGEYLGAMRAGAPPHDDFRQPLFARLGPGDSIWVFDGAARALVFSPDRMFVRSVLLPIGPSDATVLPDGRVVVASSDADNALPLFELDRRGTLLRRLGAEDSASLALHSTRRILPGNNATIWTMPVQLRWRLEHWDTVGVLATALERQPDWFAWYGQAASPTVNRAPQPQLQGAWIDGSRRVWTLALIADANWALGFGHSEADNQVIVDPDKAFDSVVEVRDLATGNLIATSRFDVAYVAVAEPGVLVRIRETRLGWKKAELMRVVLDSTHVGAMVGAANR